MSTAIIGTGNVGASLAKDLADGNEDVLIAGRDEAKARSVAETSGATVTATSVSDAINRSDIIVIAVWLDALKELLVKHESDFSGKIIVDPSNPIEDDGNGGFRKTIPDDQSSGEIIAGLLPSGALLVKAFGTLGAQSLRTSAHQTEPVVGFYATDDLAAGERVARLIAAAGFDPISVGGIDQSRRIEVFGDLHEFGALGHPATRDEAETALKG